MFFIPLIPIVTFLSLITITGNMEFRASGTKGQPFKVKYYPGEKQPSRSTTINQ